MLLLHPKPFLQANEERHNSVGNGYIVIIFSKLLYRVSETFVYKYKIIILEAEEIRIGNTKGKYTKINYYCGNDYRY